jgi:hypothetical protein
MQGLGDILHKRNLEEPPEIQVIKEFVQAKLKCDCQVLLKDDRIIIQVPSAATAGALRIHLMQLQKILRSKKKLVIRIGR